MTSMVISSDRRPFVKSFFLVVVALVVKVSARPHFFKESTIHDALLERLVVKRGTEALVNFQKCYKTFHDQLTQFTTELPQSLKPSAPEALSSQIIALTKVLSPGDSPFTRHDVKTIDKWTTLTLRVTETVLKGLEKCHYVTDENDMWFVNSKIRFKISIALVRNFLEKLRKSDIVVIGGGVGGFNTGVKNLDTGVVKQIKEVLRAIQC